MKFILMSLLSLSLNAFAGGKTVAVANPPAGKTDKKAATVAVAKAPVKKAAAKPAAKVVAKAAPAKVAAKAPAKRTPASAQIKGDVKFGTYTDGVTEIVCGHVGNNSVSCVRTNP